MGQYMTSPSRDPGTQTKPEGHSEPERQSQPNEQPEEKQSGEGRESEPRRQLQLTRRPEPGRQPEPRRLSEPTRHPRTQGPVGDTHRYNDRTTQIEPWLYVTGLKAATNADFLNRLGITAIVSILSEKPAHADRHDGPVTFVEGVNWLHMDAPAEEGDDGTLGWDMLARLTEACDFIHAHHPRGCVLVHCSMGVSRSLALVTAFLMRRGRMSPDAARAIVERRCPGVSSERFRPQLEIWWETGYEPWSDSDRCDTGMARQSKPAYGAFLAARDEALARWKGKGKAVDEMDRLKSQDWDFVEGEVPMYTGHWRQLKLYRDGVKISRSEWLYG